MAIQQAIQQQIPAASGERDASFGEDECEFPDMTPVGAPEGVMLMDATDVFVGFEQRRVPGEETVQCVSCC